MQTTGQTIIIAGSMLLFPCARPYHVSEVRRRLACVCHSFVPDLTMSLRYEDWPVCAIPLCQTLPCLSGMKTGLCVPFLCTRSYHVSQVWRLACVSHSFVPDLTMSLRNEDWPVCLCICIRKARLVWPCGNSNVLAPMVMVIMVTWWQAGCMSWGQEAIFNPVSLLWQWQTIIWAWPTHDYTVSGKKSATLFLPVTLRNSNQFSKFFYHHTL